MSALLELKGVTVRLGANTALREAYLEVAAGEVVALLGPNGAGKTTLMRSALGLVPNEGATRLNGADPRTLSARERALRAAYLPQRPQSIWPVRVDALVALGRFAHGAAPDQLAAPDQAAVDAAIVACGLEALRARRMDEISGGEKARAHLARALAQRAPLLLLDEPTAGLDPAQALAVADILRAHRGEGGGVIVSTHDISLAAAIADRIALMHGGEIIADGAPEAVLTPEALQRAYSRPARLVHAEGRLITVFD